MSIRDERKKLDEALERERQLRQQLAAAVEALSGIAGLCQTNIRYPDIFVKDVFQICTDALAKLKE